MFPVLFADSIFSKKKKTTTIVQFAAGRMRSCPEALRISAMYKRRVISGANTAKSGRSTFDDQVIDLFWFVGHCWKIVSKMQKDPAGHLSLTETMTKKC